MRTLLLLCFILFLTRLGAQSPATKWVLVIHGGAGTITRGQMSPEKEKSYRNALDSALRIGGAILQKGGAALDAVEASVRWLEDNPLFNAGKGAVFTNEGKNELDASIMNGETLEAGSVAGVTVIKNPVSAARAVMENSPHVMLAGPGAEHFARQQGLDIVDPSYFHTTERRESMEKFKAVEDEVSKKLSAVDSIINKTLRETDSMVRRTDSIYRNKLRNDRSGMQASPHDNKFGTVGAVALDLQGNLAAATSTGGMSNKRFGRIGDSPIIGAGTYANNKTAAISGTGWGEYYIRLVLAKTVSDMMEFGKMSLQRATEEMVMKRLPALGGDGGLIAVDKNGNIAMPFCTEGMYRGYMKSSGEKSVMIYKKE